MAPRNNIPHIISDGGEGELWSIRFSGVGVNGDWGSRPVRGAHGVQANDEVTLRVKGLSSTHERAPPEAESAIQLLYNDKE